MKFTTNITRKKIEVKPVKLSYYSHTPDEAHKLVPRKIIHGLRIVFSFIGIGLLITGFYFLFTHFNLLKINGISVYGENKYVSVDEVKKVSESKLLGESIINFKPLDFSRLLEASFLPAQSFSVKTKWPDQIVINITERVPVALVSNNENKYLVDAEGFVMAVADPKTDNYPLIDYKDKVDIGTFIPQNVIPQSVKIIGLAKESGIEIKNIQFSSQYITVFINGNIEVDLSLEKDNSLSMKQVKAIMEKSTTEEQKLRKVDLRFDKVIVLYD